MKDIIEFLLASTFIGLTSYFFGWDRQDMMSGMMLIILIMIKNKND